MYRCIREDKYFTWRGHEIPVRIDRPDRESDVLVILGHGLNTDMNDTVLEYLSRSLSREGLIIARFNYPFAERKWKGIPSVKSSVLLMKAVIDFMRKQAYIPDKNVIFTGGKSFSTLVSARFTAEKEYGKIFLGVPVQIKKFGLTIPVDLKPVLNQPLPMMFIQGSEDDTAPKQKIEMLMGKLNPRGYLLMIPEVNHGLVPVNIDKRSPEAINREIADIILWFVSETLRQKIKEE